MKLDPLRRDIKFKAWQKIRNNNKVPAVKVHPQFSCAMSRHLSPALLVAALAAWWWASSFTTYRPRPPGVQLPPPLNYSVTGGQSSSMTTKQGLVLVTSVSRRAAVLPPQPRRGPPARRAEPGLAALHGGRGGGQGPEAVVGQRASQAVRWVQTINKTCPR